MASSPPLDVTTIGRASVDLYGEQVGGRLEDMASFAKYVGGCPTNIAVGASRLGLRSALITRIGEKHMGRFIREQLVAEGVNVDGVITDPDRLTALVVLGIRDDETFPLIFCRENCADMALDPADLDADFIASVKAIVVTGTHFSTERVDRFCRCAIDMAKRAGRAVVFDIDYRPVLWGIGGHGSGEARFAESGRITEHLQSILPLCDLVVGTEEELHIAGGTTDTPAALRAVRRLTEATLVLKRGPMGCVVFEGAIPDDLEDGIRGPGFPVEVYNVLGAGDAFMSGFLRGWLRGEALDTCSACANACGAFAMSRHGCAPAIPTWEELSLFLEQGSAHRALRLDRKLEQVHWATTRRTGTATPMALAIDHRSQFEAMADRYGAGTERVAEFKLLAVEAARRVAAGRPGFGMLLDSRFGQKALYEASAGDLWTGRPVEQPGSRPLTFECGPDLGSALREWPLAHVVKCLVFYHPDDPEALRRQQEERVLILFDACRRTGHEMLLEVIAGKHGTLGDDSVATVLQRFYDLAVYPDWWKLEPLAGDAAWRAVGSVIADNDPRCHGVVVLGLDAPMDDLLRSLEVAAGHSVVGGVAVGRTVFAEAAERWLKGETDAAAAVAEVAERFARLAESWTAFTAERPAAATAVFSGAAKSTTMVRN